MVRIGDVFEEMQKHFMPSGVAGLSASYQFDITGPSGGVWAFVIADDACELIVGGVSCPSVRISLSDADWIRIRLRRLNMKEAFLRGLLKIEGDLDLAVKLPLAFPTIGASGVPPLINAQPHDKVTSSFGTESLISVEQPDKTTWKANSASPSFWTGPTLGDIFTKMLTHFDARQAEGIDATYQFEISGPAGGIWTFCIKDSTCELVRGVSNPSISICLADEDWLAIRSGHLTSQMAFMQGKLQIRGDMDLAIHLGNLFPIGS